MFFIKYISYISISNSMEVRKLQETAGGTFIVTIPREWAEKHKLKKGDPLMIEEEESDIIISPGKPTADVQSRKLNISDFRSERILQLCIAASYILGHDFTELYSERKMLPEQKKWIRNSIEDLMGLEISEDFSDRVVLQNLVDPMKFNPYRLVERFAATTSALFSDAGRALSEGDKSLAIDAYERGKEAERTHRLLFRLGIQAAHDKKLRVAMELNSLAGSIITVLVARDLGRISYYSMRFAQHVGELREKVKMPLVATIGEMVKITNGMIEQSAKAFTTKNVEMASFVMERMERVRKLNEQFYLQASRETDERNSLSLYLIVRDIRNVASHAVSLADDAVLFAFS